MKTTITELKAEVRNDLKCPSEYIRHLSRFNVFGDLKEAVLSDDKDIKRDIIDEIRTGYNDYCASAGLEFGADNRKARVGFFLY